MSINKSDYNDCKINIEIEHIFPDEIQIIANLYEKSFQNHFLGHMGHKFLELFISEFINSTDNYGYVAKFKNIPIGFILATTIDTPFNKFYRKNFIMLVLITVFRYFKDPFIRKHISKRQGHIYTALKALLFFLTRKSNNNGQAERVRTLVPPRLLAIAVDKNYRGLGVANELTLQFCTEMKGAGYKKVELSALPWNRRAIGFYKKDGWIEEESSETSISFSRLI
ncbi:MAG: GNAT family N-acetyltransferase [Desulfosporosinus sp.]|nr:GNAT family N-acetyltransferase [Desulfosporosinus sp.]